MDLPASLHPEYKDEVETTLSALCEAFPQVVLTEVRMFSDEGDRSLGRAKGNTIELNAYWFARPKQVMLDAVDDSRNSTPFGAPKWHGGIGGAKGEVKRLLNHEFAHLLAEYLTGYRTFARRHHREALANPELAVSGYALCDDEDEWFAETFAALRLGGNGSPQCARLEAFLAGQK